MARLRALAALPSALSILALGPAPAGAAEGWHVQRYAATSQLEVDAESLAHPASRALTLVVPAAVPAGEACVEVGSSAQPAAGRNQVTVVVRRAGRAQQGVEVARLPFAWRDDDPPLVGERCQPVPPLVAGDLVEFRFRFFDKQPLRLWRRGQRIEILPHLTVTGWVQHEPRPE